jgi:hypothetical protein
VKPSLIFLLFIASEYRAQRVMTVVIGGEETKMQTYADLVTAIIHPSIHPSIAPHHIVKGYDQASKLWSR